MNRLLNLRLTSFLCARLTEGGFVITRELYVDLSVVLVTYPNIEVVIYLLSRLFP